MLEIIWSDHAENEFISILQYYSARNLSNQYSIKLKKIFQNSLKMLSAFPEMGRSTDFADVRAMLIEKFYVFYEISELQIKILSVWDTRQDPENAPYTL